MRIQSWPDRLTLDDDLVVGAENLPVLSALPRGAFDLVYMDPPFNTGRVQSRDRVRWSVDDSARRIGFGGRRYSSTLLESLSYDDRFGDYLGFLEPRLRACRELLAEHGTLYFHIDYREAHYCKLLLDEIFGRDAFLNEIIWAYDYGAKPRRRWPAKHDTILVYVRCPGAHHFDADAVEREPYMAPGLVSAEKARAASGRQTSGFTRSCRPRAPRRPATRRRSRRGYCAGSLPRPHGPAVGAWTRSRAPGRSARSPPAWQALRPDRFQPDCDRGDQPSSRPGRPRTSGTESDSVVAAAGDPVAGPSDHGQSLIAHSDRRDQPATGSQLRDQQRRHLLAGCRSDVDRIKRSVLR